MERALGDLLETLGSMISVTLVIINGQDTISYAGESCQLNAGSGYKGRLHALARIRRIAQKNDATPIVAVGAWATVTTGIATLGLPVRIISWEHTLLPWRLKHEEGISRIATLLRILSFKVSHVVAVSEATAASVSGVHSARARISVIPNILGTSQKPRPVVITPERDPNDVILLGVGSLTSRKNWELAISSLSLLPPNYRLWLAGEGKNRAQLEMLIADLRISERVELLGYRDDVPSLLSQADIVVHPSYAETFGYSLMEAADQNKPLVTLAQPVMDEFVGTLVCGICSQRADPKAYAAAIREVSNTVFDFDAMRAARELRLSASDIAARWISVIVDADRC